MVNPMTAATIPDIAPRLVEGEPVCSGEECPACESVVDIYRTLVCSVLGRVAPSGRTCVEGLRRQRDALQAEIDRLQRRGK